MTAPAPSMGSPTPLKILPSRSFETGMVMPRPRNRTVARVALMPWDDSNSWTTARPSLASSTCPRRMSAAASSTSTSSP